MPIKARRCFVPLSPSDWVAKVFLTCDNQIAVQFNHGEKVKKILPHGPGAYLGHGGVPSVCCLYPGTQGDLAETLYELAQVWSYAGEWVHTFLYKKFGYQLVAPPTACGNCATSCAITLSPASPASGQAVTITVTVTNTDGSVSKGAAPEGTVVISVDGSVLATLTLPDIEPDSQNYATVSTSWTASCTPTAYHTISAVYTPSEADFAGTSCSTGVTVTGCGITTSCCPSVSLPETLYVTITNADNCNGTYALTYDGSLPGWSQSFPGGWGNCNPDGYLILKCTGSGWTFQSQGNINPISPSSVSCSPFQLVFSAIDDCCGSFPHPLATYTVTE